MHVGFLCAPHADSCSRSILTKSSTPSGDSKMSSGNQAVLYAGRTSDKRFRTPTISAVLRQVRLTGSSEWVERSRLTRTLSSSSAGTRCPGEEEHREGALPQGTWWEDIPIEDVKALWEPWLADSPALFLRPRVPLRVRQSPLPSRPDDVLELGKPRRPPQHPPRLIRARH